MIQAYNPRSFSHSHQRPVKLGKTIEKWFLYLVVLGIAGVSLYWFIIGKGKEFEVNLIAKKGTVEYRENEGAEWKTIENLPLKIKSSSEIRTMADSEASFSITDGSRIKLGSFSRIVLSKNQGEIDWVQTDGNSHHQTAKNAERKSYKVSISDGDFETVGTAFEVKIRDTETVALVLKNQLKASYKDKSTAEAKAGEKIVIDPLGKKVKEIEDQDLKDSWTLANLMDDEKNNLPIEENVLAKAGLREQITDNSQPDDIGSPDGSAQNSQQADNNNENNASKNTNNNINQENAAQSSKITLQAKQSTNGVLLEWGGNQGNWEAWKVLKGGGAELTYPNDSYRTVPKDAKSYLWEMSGDNNTYYFRVCAWSADKGCVGYSNSESLTTSASNTTAETVNENSNANSSVTENQESEGSKKSGVTTRKKCEGSGGHWTETTKVCKCPPKEVFVSSVGRCQKK